MVKSSLKLYAQLRSEHCSCQQPNRQCFVPALATATGLLINQHIEAETRWLPFSGRHFQMHFLERKYMNLDKDFTEVCS